MMLAHRASIECGYGAFLCSEGIGDGVDSFGAGSLADGRANARERIPALWLRINP